MALTHAGMIAEQAVRAFWPFATICLAVAALLLTGWLPHLPLEALWGLAAVGALAGAVALGWGVRTFEMPSREAAVARVDARLPGRPIAAVTDRQGLGGGDLGSVRLWRAHQERMEAATEAAQPVPPVFDVAQRDPYGLRFMALIALVLALLFGSAFRGGGEVLVAGGSDPATPVITGPAWEGWLRPPAYTGKPTLYLNDIPEGPLDVPQGSEITLRLYGEVGELTVAETVSARTGELPPASASEQRFTVVQPGRLSIDGTGGRAWEVSVIADAAPRVSVAGEPEIDAIGEWVQPFEARDDYGIESGTATVALDLAAVDRRYGLAAEPDPRAALVLDLPMPFTGDRAQIEEELIENLSEHPLANLPVTLVLEVTDSAGQTARSEVVQMVLPGRRFFQPMARAVIEQRRDLMWSRSNAARVTQVLRAISHRPEGLFSNQTSYLRMRTVIRRLEAAGLDDLPEEARAEAVDALWDLAVQLEDGRLKDARERLRRAQERLAEAMRNGATDEEIAELMQELREATDDYMRLLAEEAEPQDGTDQPDMSQNSQSITQDELQALMDRIEELMQEGRMAEAQALMEELNRMMENMRVTQGEGGDGPQTPGQQSMQDLSDTLRDQQELSDDSFSELQDRFNQTRPGEPNQRSEQGGQPNQGQPGQEPGESDEDAGEGRQGQGQGVGEDSEAGSQNGGGAGSEGEPRDLAGRQEALREELERQREALPQLEGEAGEIARRALELAERAMEEAEQALREGDLAEAIDRQAEAMDALRNGMRELGRALAENRSEPGQGSEQGQADARPTPGRRDPLGREAGNMGQLGTEEGLLGEIDPARRAQELLGEIRRRQSERERPELELDYLERLLDQF